MRPTFRLPIAALALLLAAPALAAPAAAPKFKVQVTLSAQAQARLAKLKEAITVSAMYSGAPNKAGAKIAMEGEIDLGNEEITKTPAGAALDFDFVGKGYKAGDLKYVAGKPRLLINVYSARRVADDNLLDCAIHDGAIDAAGAKPIAIACKLIEE